MYSPCTNNRDMYLCIVWSMHFVEKRKQKKNQKYIVKLAVKCLKVCTRNIISEENVVHCKARRKSNGSAFTDKWYYKKTNLKKIYEIFKYFPTWNYFCNFWISC